MANAETAEQDEETRCLQEIPASFLKRRHHPL